MQPVRHIDSGSISQCPTSHDAFSQWLALPQQGAIPPPPGYSNLHMHICTTPPHSATYHALLAPSLESWSSLGVSREEAPRGPKIEQNSRSPSGSDIFNRD